MNLQTTLHRLTHEPAYFFGRFYTLRKSYAGWQKIAGGRAAVQPGSKRLFDFDKEKMLADLERDAVGFGIQLPKDYVDKLRQFALTQPLLRWNGGSFFYHKDVVNGQAPDGPVAIAEVMNKELSPEIAEIANEPLLLDTVSKYLGYKNLRQRINLFWTFAGNLDPHERIQQNQTIEYHFDVHSWNFCYLHIYLTDCDRTNGAHEMVKGSHKNKPTSWLWGSAKKGDQEIAGFYAPQNLLTIEGQAGTGFLEDTSCYHRALAPQSANRLLLQVRYF